MKKTEYQKQYRKSYKNKNKIISFPVTISYFQELEKRAAYFDITINSYTKKIIISFLKDKPLNILNLEQKKFISDYIHISR
jgi:hypothetical protein